SAIEQAGGSVVVATRTGSQMDQDDCIVSNVWDAPFLREGSPANGEVHVALNCNGGVAAAGSSGNSAASPEGRRHKAQAQREAARAEREALQSVSTPDS